MTDRGDFLAFCAEIYRIKKDLPGKKVSELFSKYGVREYLWEGYGSLHTTGSNYIVNDIDDFIAVRS